MKILLFFCLSLLSYSAYCQEVTNQDTNSIAGTYQIQLINTRSNPFIPGNLKELVVTNRHETEIKYIMLGTQVRLKIAPGSEIKNPGFIPWEEFVRITE